MIGSQCQACIWHIAKRSCSAYPKETIPLKFIMNKKNHVKKQKNQVGDFVFEQWTKQELKNKGVK